MLSFWGISLMVQAVYTDSLTFIFNDRISAGTLLLTSCLVAYKLPTIIINFHQLFLEDQLQYKYATEKSISSRTLSKPTTPYFLLEDGSSIPFEVNHTLETVIDHLLLKGFILPDINIMLTLHPLVF